MLPLQLVQPRRAAVEASKKLDTQTRSTTKKQASKTKSRSTSRTKQGASASATNNSQGEQQPSSDINYTYNVEETPPTKTGDLKQEICACGATGAEHLKGTKKDLRMY